MGSPLTLNFQPATGFSLPGMLYCARNTVDTLKVDGAFQHFATFDRIAACFQQAASLTLDQLVPGTVSTANNWITQNFTHAYRDSSGLATLCLQIAAMSQLPPPQPGDSIQTFALLTVTISADDQRFELGLEIQSYFTELAQVAGSSAIGAVLLQIARAGGRAVWNSICSVFQQSVADPSVLGSSESVADATGSAVDEELGGEALVDSMELEGLTDITAVVSAAAPIVIPVAILLGALFFIALLFRKKITVITHEIHLINNMEHQPLLMNLTANDNSEVIQYPSLTSDSSLPITQNYQPCLPFPMPLDIATQSFSTGADDETAATAIFKFINSDHKNPATQSLFLAFTPPYAGGYGYELCFHPNTSGKVKLFALAQPSVQSAMKLPSDNDSHWTYLVAGTASAANPPQFTYRDTAISLPVTITVASSYQYTPSSGKDNPDTYAYRTLVLFEQDAPVDIDS